MIAALAIAAIAYFCTKNNVPKIEKDLSSRAQQALGTNGIDWATASIKGRDITLTGVAPTEEMKQEAGKLAQVNGVTFVDNQMTILGQEVGQEGQLSEKEKALAADGYALTVSSDDTGKIILDGVMSAEARQQVLGQFKGKVDANNLVDNITIKDIDAPKDLPQLAGSMLDNISTLDKGAAATLSGQKLLISGTSPKPDTLDQVKQQAEAGLPEGYTAEFDVALASPEGKDGTEAGVAKDTDPASAGGNNTAEGNLEKEAVAATDKNTDPANPAGKKNAVAEKGAVAGAADKKADPAGDKTVKVKKPSKAEAKQCQRQLSKVLRARKVYFNSSSAVIKKSSRKVLNRLAAVAKKCSSHKIRVHGHTDATGRNKLNKKLSRLRAQAVVNYLAKKGVNAKHLKAVGHGSSKPIASNKTPKGRARNRRIELTVED